MNVGTDVGFYVFILITMPLVLLAVGFAFSVTKVAVSYYNNLDHHITKRWAGISLILLALFIFFSWIRFGAYGPGEEARLTPAYKDGANILNESAPDEKTEEEVKKEAEDSKNEMLKQVQDHAWGKGEEDDFQKYLEEALKVKNYHN